MRIFKLSKVPKFRPLKEYFNLWRPFISSFLDCILVVNCELKCFSSSILSD